MFCKFSSPGWRHVLLFLAAREENMTPFIILLHVALKRGVEAARVGGGLQDAAKLDLKPPFKKPNLGGPCKPQTPLTPSYVLSVSHLTRTKKDILREIFRAGPICTIPTPESWLIPFAFSIWTFTFLYSLAHVFLFTTTRWSQHIWHLHTASSPWKICLQIAHGSAQWCSMKD